ncbi:MAG: toll/interleukin-1 receptor domain-containing protein [Bauldia sp.]
MSTFAITIVWHRKYEAGRTIAEALAGQFEGAEDEINSAGLSIPVRIRCEGRDPKFPDSPPLDIETGSDIVNFVVLLVESDLVSAFANGWSSFADALWKERTAHPERMRVLPIRLGTHAEIPPFAGIQAYATSLFPGAGPADPVWMRRLVLTVVAHFADYLRAIDRSARDQSIPVDEDTDRFKLFLSHAKRDGLGVANAIKKHLSCNNYGVESFFDAEDLKAGLNYQNSFTSAIRKGAVVVIRSDAYSSRPWCRWETLEGKRLGRPIVVLDFLRDSERRGNPYGGNVPALRLADLPADDSPELDRAILAIMTEAVRILVWNMRVPALANAVPAGYRDWEIRILPRPPELVDIANLRLESKDARFAVIHPGPPVTQAEDALIKAIGGDLVMFAPSDLGVAL